MVALQGKIEAVIADLAQKKIEALQKTWAKVNADFGSIFSTLLPGTNAKLEPQAGCPVEEGLEVKVAFGAVWKQSLTELSGGQRSLVALSLVLSLLRFKPAPVYILDEIDAALDLSHTQNIGQMIRAHFKQSQFVVVSLKEGERATWRPAPRRTRPSGTRPPQRPGPPRPQPILHTRRHVQQRERALPHQVRRRRLDHFAHRPRWRRRALGQLGPRAAAREGRRAQARGAHLDRRVGTPRPHSNPRPPPTLPSPAHPRRLGPAYVRGACAHCVLRDAPPPPSPRGGAVPSARVTLAVSPCALTHAAPNSIQRTVR